MFACKNGHPITVTQLLRAGAHIGLRNDDRHSASQFTFDWSQKALTAAVYPRTNPTLEQVPLPS